MGRMRSEGLAAAVDLGMPLEVALDTHLLYNHYPPVPLCYVPVAAKAIIAVNAGDVLKLFRLPNGMTKTAREVIESLHLEPFLAEDADEEEAWASVKALYGSATALEEY